LVLTLSPVSRGLLAQEEPAPAAAEGEVTDSWRPSVELHGLGGWFYAKTDGNAYLGGTESGEYRNAQMALNLKAEPLRNLEIRAQFDWEQTGEERDVELDYAFAEWRVSDALRLRFGQAQQPFGLYSEVFDVGTIRPFLSLPSSFYGPVGLAVESYLGVGITGNRPLPSGWNLAYDLYGGGVDLDHGRDLTPGGEEDEGGEELESLRDVVGGRLNLESPTGRLGLGASLYAGRENDTKRRHQNVALHGQYLTDRLWLRSEVAYHEEVDEHTSKVGYVEAAWFLTRRWQIAGRYDRIQSDSEERVPSELASLLEHRDVAFGLNFWPVENLVLKLSIHGVEGNQIARGGEEGDADAPGDRKTRYAAFGAQFSF
jgi:hypothetical protein